MMGNFIHNSAWLKLTMINQLVETIAISLFVLTSKIMGNLRAMLRFWGLILNCQCRALISKKPYLLNSISYLRPSQPTRPHSLVEKEFHNITYDLLLALCACLLLSHA